MRPIFISYRRDDTEGQAGRLFEDLREVFGAQNVFMDVATIEPGVDFRRAIEKNTEACGVLLALIGRNWVTVADEQGRRRIDDPNDFVRLETAAALRRDIPVVPVLVQGARMPRAADLPKDLEDLAFRNGVELTHARWESDVQVLIAALRKLLARYEEAAGAGSPAAGPVPSPPAVPAGNQGRPRWLLPAVGAIAVLVALGGLLMLRSPSVPPADQDVAVAAREQAERDRAARERAERERIASEEAARSEAAQREAAQREAAQREAAQREAAQREAARQEAARREAEARRQQQIRAHQEGICITGFVWREARPGDKVCVTPLVRKRTAAENNRASLRRSPTGGPYGPDTCRSGYVWREAYPGDVVCVEPASRKEAADDNRRAAERVVPLPP